MRRILPFLLIFTLIISILVLPSFALEVTDTTTWQYGYINRMDYYNGTEIVSITPTTSSSFVISGSSYFPESFYGLTAYSSRFDVPILSYTSIYLYFFLTPSVNLDTVYSSADTVYLTFSFSLSCSSTNFNYPDTVAIDSSSLNKSYYFTKVSDLSSSGHATYVGTIEFDPSLISDISSWGWSVYLQMAGQMQGYQVYFAYTATDPIYTFTYEESQAVERATFDVVSNQLAPTVQNISVKADQIIQQQQEISGQLGEIQGSLDTMNNTLESMPEEIGDEVQDALESVADEEYNKALEDGDKNVTAVLDAITIDTSSFLSSLRSLVNSMGYTGTECHWTFPALSIPAVAGVGPFQLSPEMDIDIGGYIREFIPSTVLSVIQYVLTAALVLFILKEALDR